LHNQPNQPPASKNDDLAMGVTHLGNDTQRAPQMIQLHSIYIMATDGNFTRCGLVKSIQQSDNGGLPAKR